MLHPEKILDRIIALLQAINPFKELPAFLRPFLSERMSRGSALPESKILEREGKVPKHAWYIVTGFIIVYGFDERGRRFPFRIYGANSIVALNCFMKECKSAYRIKACKGTVLWGITASDVKDMYGKEAGMELFANKAALDFSDAHETLRANLLGMEPRLRIIEFYLLIHPELLPVKDSPVFDGEIAKYLGIPLKNFRRMRKILLDKSDLD